MKYYNALFISVIITLITISCVSKVDTDKTESNNLAIIASANASSSYRSAESMRVLNDGIIPEDVGVLSPWIIYLLVASWIFHQLGRIRMGKSCRYKSDRYSLAGQ